MRAAPPFGVYDIKRETMITDDVIRHVRRLVVQHSCREMHEMLLPMFKDLTYVNVQEIEADVISELQELERSKKEYLQSNRLRDYAAALINFMEYEPWLGLDDRIRLHGEYNKVINALL